MPQESSALIEGPSYQCSESHRHDDAEGRNDHGSRSRRFKLLQIGAESCGEHDEDDSDLREYAEFFFYRIGEEHILQRFTGDIFQKPDQEPCNQHADNGRKPDFLRTKSEKFCHNKNDRKGQKNFKRGHKNSFKLIQKCKNDRGGREEIKFHFPFTFVSIGYHYTPNAFEKQMFPYTKQAKKRGNLREIKKSF